MKMMDRGHAHFSIWWGHQFLIHVNAFLGEGETSPFHALAWAKNLVEFVRDTRKYDPEFVPPSCRALMHPVRIKITLDGADVLRQEIPEGVRNVEDVIKAALGLIEADALTMDRGHDVGKG